MTGDKRIVYALTRLWKAGKPSLLAERIKPVHAAGKHLMHIALMSDVEHKPVTAGVEYAVNGDRCLNNAKIRRQMAAGAADILHKKLPNFVA